MEPSESLDVESGKGPSVQKECVPLYERCWIFKPNKNFVPKTNNSMIKKDVSRIDFNLLQDQHIKFLAKIAEYQQSLPPDKVEQSSVVTQVTPDSANIKNLFVNNEIPYKGNMNLKVITSNTTQRKVTNTITLNNGRLFRQGLSRKCKDKVDVASSSLLTDDEDEDDDFLPATDFCKLKIKRDTPLKNGSESKTTTIVKERKLEASPLDLLLGDDVSADCDEQPVKFKKRKTDINNPTKDAKGLFEEFNTSVKVPIESDIKRISRKKGATIGIGKENISNIIEIDSEMTEIENIQTNANTTNIQSSKVSCPMCSKLFASDEINNHAYTCQGPQAQTRNQRNSQDAMKNFNAKTWEMTCEGLGDNEHISIDNKKDNIEQQGMMKNNSAKHFISKSSDGLSNIFKSEKPIGKGSIEIRNGEQKKNRLASSKTSGYVNLSNYSTQDLLENHAKTVHNCNLKKKPAAKQLRLFGDLNESSQEMVRCGRCEQYVQDDELKAHTDSCLEKSLLV